MNFGVTRKKQEENPGRAEWVNEQEEPPRCDLGAKWDDVTTNPQDVAWGLNVKESYGENDWLYGDMDNVRQLAAGG
jgi:hypothetical protein